jgi:hypothetical protein
MRRILLALLVFVAALPALPAQAAIDPRNVKVTWARVLTGLDSPLSMTHPPGDSRLFITERSGRIRVVRNGVLKSTPFLDISRHVNTDGEGGLLSVAFKPDFARSGRFFVAFSDHGLRLRIRRYRATCPTCDTAYATGVDVITIPHPGATNHWGGQLAFGPANYLFVSTGDGGGGGDPNGNAQSLNSLLGKILRLDITNYRGTSTTAYSSPAGNPYYGATPGRGEIWASGLRNPWRFSFDIGNSDLYVGDVGQSAREEVDKFAMGGRNLGWDCREGTLNTATQYGGAYCKSSGYIAPIYEYDHSLGCAIIGGYTYRGTRYSSIAGGHYVFGDYCSGRIWVLGLDSSGRRVAGVGGQFPGNILAFGRSNARELYLLAANGEVYRLAFSAK